LFLESANSILKEHVDEFPFLNVKRRCEDTSLASEHYTKRRHDAGTNWRFPQCATPWSEIEVALLA
jgi:hypothetical protein